jgi:hypothetical protein
MLRALARLLILRILPRRLVPVLTLYEAYRLYRDYRRRQRNEARARGARPVDERDRGTSDPGRRSGFARGRRP